jgi:hypothetical protein
MIISDWQNANIVTVGDRQVSTLLIDHYCPKTYQLPEA